MKYIYFSLSFLVVTSCIPYKFAPKIKGDHVQSAKKIHRKLPRSNAFIFEDPKDAGAFYDYLFYKLKPDPDLHPDDFAYNLPADLDGIKGFLTFYEVERTSNTMNLIPLVIDAAFKNKDREPLFNETSYATRTGHWYIVMILRDDGVNDMLNTKHKYYEIAKKYLSDLKKEYLNTSNYRSLLLTSSD